MVTAAILGAAVGAGLALTITLTLLIYRYYVSQKSEDDLWSSWEREGYRSRSALEPTVRKHSRMNSKAAQADDKPRHKKHHYPVPARSLASRKPLYLPLNNSDFLAESNTELHVIQPPVRDHMSSCSSGRKASGPGPAGGSGSVDIPSCQPVAATSPACHLPHQSQSLPPLIPRLMRTQSTSSSGGEQQPAEQPPSKNRGEIATWISGLGDNVNRISSSWMAAGHVTRSPSPNRQRLATSPTPVSSSNLGLTPYPSPMISPAPSHTSLLTCADRASVSSPLASPSVRSANQSRCRSPMLSSLTKMNSVQSSCSSTSTQSQGSTTSLSTLTNSAHTPIGTLQPELYRRETIIVLDNNGTSSTDEDGATASPPWSAETERTPRGRTATGVTIGRLHFRLSYDFNKSDLLVHLIEVRDLSLSSESGGSTCSSGSGSLAGFSGGKDAHVRICLMPEVDQRRRQAPLRYPSTSSSSSNEVDCFFFDEHFKFPVSHDSLADKTLVFQVCDYDRFSRPCVIGDLQLALADRDIASAVDIWGDIVRNTQPDEERPQLLISLSYLPSAERLTVVVLKAKNLVVPANKETIDPMVKLYLMINGKRIKKKKTEVRKGTGNPIWNQALTFTVPSPKLHSCTLEISVIDHNCDRGGKTAQLGCVVLGPDQNQAERQHWQDMSHNVRKSIAMWHSLR